jgi:hypothetical protein
MPSLALRSIFLQSSPLRPRLGPTALFLRKSSIYTPTLLEFHALARSSKHPLISFSLSSLRHYKLLTLLSAWDNAEFRDAVRATGAKNLIVGGIVTDVCTTLLALSLRAEGYNVYHNVEASGALSELAASTSRRRMEAAGVQSVTTFAIVGELSRSWATFPYVDRLVPYMNKYFPIAAMLTQGHTAAQNSTSA